MQFPRRWTSCLIALSLCCGCAGMPSRTEPLPSLPAERAQGVVFVADGAGGLGGTTRVLEHVIAEQRVALRVEKVDWSHGTGRFLADHFHWRNIEAHGEQLAHQTRTWRQRHPEHRIHLVGQSAGSAVILIAAARLPRDSIDRIILLAPSVSSRYDLRPALACARHGIDVFYSHKDWFVLGIGTMFGGTTDRGWPDAAGRVGFQEHIENPRDRTLYARLRQHPWTPEASRHGNSGGHYGADHPDHVRLRVLPLLAPAKSR